MKETKKMTAEQLANQYAAFMSKKENIGKCSKCPEKNCNRKSCWVEFAQQH